MKRGTPKHMNVMKVSLVNYPADSLFLPEQEAATGIIAQTVFAAYIWTLSPEIGRRTAVGLWSL